MAISLGGFSGGGGGASTDTLDDVTGRGATTTNAITVGGVTVGTEYSLPTLDGSENQVLQTNGTGTLSFATLDFTGGLEYKGAFNATAGTPSLANAEKGDFYIIDTAGTIYGQTWAVGDHLLINEDMGGSITNSKIDKIDNTQAVTSVNTQTGAVVVSGNDILADHTAVNYTASNNNVDGHFSGVDTKLGTLLSDITSESLNDLSDVSFTAGAGIDNYVLTYDNATTSWGAEAVPDGSPASETVAGVIEIATNAEAGAGTATDKALVPSNISSLDLSAMDNTTSTFIALSDIPTASHSTAGILETATNAEATNATANDKIITPANLSHIDLSTFDNDAGFISDITSESLNDLSDVSFTAGAGIDNYVLTYDNATTSWGAEAIPSTSLFTTTSTTNATYDASVNEIINLQANTGGEIRVNLPSSAGNGDIIILRKPSATSSGDPAGQATKITVYDNGGTKLRDLEMYPVSGSHILSYDGTDWTFPVTNLIYQRVTGTSTTVFGYRFGRSIIYADSADTADFTVAISVGASSLLEGARQRIICRSDRNVIITSTSTDIVDPTSGGASSTLSNSITIPAHSGMIEIWVNSQSQYVISAPLANLGTSAFLDVGTSANNVIQLDGTAKLPAVDGSQLTNLSGGSPASETVAGVIEIATNAEATAGTATDKALVPSNLSSVDLSVLDNTTSAFITAGDIPTASETVAGVIEIATNAEATAGTATDKALVPSNISSLDLSAMDNTTSGFISGITSESLNDLSDVSFTAGAGIDNYVLTYDHATTSWGAEASAGGGGGGGYTYSAITADPANAQYDYHYSCTGTFTVTLPASAGADAGKEIRIKNMGTGTITVDGNSTETIDGQTTIDLDTQYSSITLIATGNTPAAWEIV